MALKILPQWPQDGAGIARVILVVLQSADLLQFSHDFRGWRERATTQTPKTCYLKPILAQWIGFNWGSEGRFVLPTIVRLLVINFFLY